MSNFITEIFLVFVVPWAIMKIIAYVRTPSNKNAQKSQQEAPKKATVNHLINFVLMGATFYFAFQAIFNHPKDFFKDLDVDYDAPNYLLRNQFRDYIAQQRVVDDTLEQPNPAIKMPRGTADLFADYDDDEIDMSAGYSKHDYLFGLFELLKTNVNRQYYTTFGESTFVNCEWCRDKGDFFWFAFAELALPYILMAIFLMAITSVDPFKNHFGWSTSLLSSLLMFDISFHAVPQEVMVELSGTLAIIPYHNYFHIARNALFAFICSILWFQRNSQKVTKEDTYQQVINREKTFLTRLNAVCMQSMSVLEDEDLFKEFTDYHKRSTVGMVLRSYSSEDKTGVRRKDLEKVKQLVNEASHHQEIKSQKL